MSGTEKSSTTRRNLLQTAAVAGASTALLGGFGVSPGAGGGGRSEKPLKAAFSNAGLQATWCAQGKQAAEYWGKLFNVEVTWFDGQLDAVKQRAAIDNMASQKWDFVAIQAFGIGTLTAPVQKMIDAGIPVIDMDTLIAPLDQINVHTLPRARQRVHGRVGDAGARHRHRRQGQDHHDAGRARPYRRAGPRQRLRVGRQAVSRTSRCSTPSRPTGTSPRRRASGRPISPNTRRSTRPSSTMTTWRSPPHNVMKARNRTNILIGGVDAMPPAIQAVSDGRMFATVRNPSCRIHGGAIVAGVAAVSAGEKTGEGIPKHVITDGPVVTKANAAGMQWMQDHFLI